MIISCNTIPNKKKSETHKKSSTFSFVIFDSISSLNINHWNSVINYGSEFLETPYLAVLENERPDNMRFYYVIIYNFERPVAITYFQVVNLSSGNFESLIEQEGKDISCIVADHLKKHFTNHLKRNADKINMRILICGNAFISGEHGFTCSPEIDKMQAFGILADVMYGIGRAEKLRGKIAATLVKDFYTSGKNPSYELTEFNYHDFLVEPNMIVDVQWKTFDEYINSMNKKYRHRAKNVLKKEEYFERRFLSSADIKSNASQIHQLYKNVHLKAKFRLASLPVNYFAEMKDAMKDKFTFLAYYKKGKMIGFKTSFILKKSVEAHFIGLDYTINKELDLYQNILYDYVKEAIENKISRLFLGRTASEIKTTVGARAHELICYVKHRNPLSNHIIKPFIDHLKPVEWVPRNPFKEISV